LVCAYER